MQNCESAMNKNAKEKAKVTSAFYILIDEDDCGRLHQSCCWRC